MKRILIVAMLLGSATLTQGADKDTGVVAVVKTAAIYAVGKYTGPVIVLPLLALELSAGQREYNRVNGIHHSRGERKQINS